MVPKTSDADHKLVCELIETSKRAPKLVHSSTYKAPALPEMSVRSWKMNEFKYYDVPSPFPTLARGLFTTENEDGTHRIVGRGYDKFFNIGEVPWTKWDTLESHTAPPYVMTLKSNGCIIFIAAITPDKLLVTSKHSLGPIQGVPVSHAQMGESWLVKHLVSKGKTLEQFAKVLWDNNWTAVAELCDDSFEEHVLPYAQDKTGLHLHGLNQSSGAFNTESSEKVASFARDWGFIETAFHTVESISEVKAFSEQIAKSGSWNGEAIEGFVVRCHVSSATDLDKRSAPPYPPGSSFFFKVKYDEPYMMYRDWREITKKLLASKGPIQEASAPKGKLRRPESQLYFKWVKDEIARDRRPFEGFNKGHGIIATRERFLKWLSEEKGEELSVRMESLNIGDNDKREEHNFTKTIIVPIAVPGCGKTTVAVALSRLFDFGHIQSDDVKAKKPGREFVNRVMRELREKYVVIADKNNHLKKHRDDLRRAIENSPHSVRLMGLYWPLDQPPAVIHRICADRIVDRGDNHQTLRADVVAKKHEEVIWMFINKAEELDESELDEVVEMSFEEDLEQCLDRAVDACVRILGVQKPSQEEIGQALAAARGYTVKVKQEKLEKEKKKASREFKPRYYALLPEFDVEDVVANRLTEGDVPENVTKMWEALKQGGRITKVPHVTIVHTKSLPDEQALWERCQALFSLDSPPTFEFEIGSIVANERVMVLTVDNLRVATDPGIDTPKHAQNFVSLLNDDLKGKLHITVGTRNKDIQAVEGRALITDWRNNTNSTDVSSLPLKNVVVRGRVKGMMS